MYISNTCFIHISKGNGSRTKVVTETKLLCSNCKYLVIGRRKSQKIDKTWRSTLAFSDGLGNHIFKL